MKKKQNEINQQIGLSHMVRDVLIASMNKGQFPLAMCGIIALVILLRLPQKDLAALVGSFLNCNPTVFLVIMFSLSAGWFFHVRYQRTIYEVEVERVAEVRNQLQSEKLGNKIKSSREEE